MHVTTILVHHDKHLLNDVIELTGRNTQPMKQASHEWRMLAEQLLRRYARRR
jgi:hypothetical protein